MTVTASAGRDVLPARASRPAPFPPPAAPVRELAFWSVTLLRAVAAGLLAVLGGLLVWSLLPLLVGWQSHVVLSGSMAPAVHAGDVVLTQPPDDLVLHPGMVVLFDDPARPGGTLLHRVAGWNDDGTLSTRGDANATADHAPLLPQDVHGVGRLRVPLVGSLVLWAHQGRWTLVAGAVAVVLGACALVALGSGRDDEPDDEAPVVPAPA